MKRLFQLTALFLVFCTLAACSAGEAGPSNVKAPTKALVIGGGAGDAFIAKRLQEMGMEVVVKSDNAAKTEDANGMDLIYISYTTGSGRVSNKFKNVAVPIIYSKSQVAVANGLISSTEKLADASNEKATKTVAIVNEQHPVAAGLKGDVDVYTNNGTLSFATPLDHATIVATVPGKADKATLFVYEKGDKDALGNPFQARQVYFFISYQQETKMSEEGWKLFDAAVKWATGQL